eukprot:GHRQ01009673.1.p1 GENE.GHRQ01009673.1~~GHRQ01009673.1.p1  ORF type:complete len:207 (+),score=38.41 GHRQ01009673.1:193-813(+)
MQVAAGAASGAACKMQRSKGALNHRAGSHAPFRPARPAFRHFGVALRQLPLAEPLRAVRADQATESLDAAVVQVISQITGVVDESMAKTLAASAEAAQQVGTTTDSELRSKVVGAVHKLQTGLLERETEVRLMLLASLCGEHLLLLGPPGTAKSELARRLSGLAQGAYFERLLTRFSVPEELFGPLSMQGTSIMYGYFSACSDVLS